MRKLAVLMLAGAGLAASSFVGGCASPAYSAKENVQRVAQTWDYDAKQAVDDWDHLALLRPASTMTIWNARVGRDN